MTFHPASLVLLLEYDSMTSPNARMSRFDKRSDEYLPCRMGHEAAEVIVSTTEPVEKLEVLSAPSHPVSERWIFRLERSATLPPSTRLR